MGKKSSKTKSTNEPPKWARPHLEGAANQISNVVGSNQGNLDQIAGQMRGYLPQLGQMAFGQNPGLNAATGYATDVLGGKYLGAGNPYLNDMVDTARGNTMDSINSNFALGGRVGSDLHFEDLGRGMMQAETGLRYQDYGNERNAMTQAAGMMPALNASQYAGVMPYTAMSQAAAGTPYMGIGNLGQIGGLFGGYGTQTAQQPGGWGTAIASGIASALPFVLSEPEAKTNIKLLRREPDGLGWYEFAYKREPDVMLQGVMADEVEKLRPHALGPRLSNGWRTVNYAALGAA